MACDHSGHLPPPALHSRHEPLVLWTAGTDVLDHECPEFLVTKLNNITTVLLHKRWNPALLLWTQADDPAWLSDALLNNIRCISQPSCWVAVLFFGIFCSYSKIISSIRGISSAQGKYKAFSTCAKKTPNQNKRQDVLSCRCLGTPRTSWQENNWQRKCPREGKPRRKIGALQRLSIKQKNILPTPTWLRSLDGNRQKPSNQTGGRPGTLMQPQLIDRGGHRRF